MCVSNYTIELDKLTDKKMFLLRSLPNPAKIYFTFL